MKHKFVEYIPEQIEERTIYISMEYGTAVHKCACGCGEEVVTPLTPHDWTLIYNGESISLRPSIGNWSLKCQSHYWITEDKIEWAHKWSKDKINKNRKQDSLNKKKYFNSKTQKKESSKSRLQTFWQKIKQGLD